MFQPWEPNLCVLICCSTDGIREATVLVACGSERERERAREREREREIER